MVLRSNSWFEANYQIKSLIGPGATSVVCSALKISEDLSVPWKVALKFVWNPEVAKAEAEKLVSLDEIRGVVNLLDYFEISASVVAPLMEEIRGHNVSAPTSILHRQLDQIGERPIGVLVLQYLTGKPLIRTTSTLKEEPKGQMAKDCFYIKDAETNVWMKQQLSANFTIAEKLHLLEQITTHIAECHANNVVHADLNPQNILYNPTSMGITILDFGGSITRGSPGWQAPGHLAAREIITDKGVTYNRHVDIFLLGLFIYRLFENENFGELRSLAEGCFLEPEKRPSADHLLSMIRKIRARHLKTPLERFGIPVLTLLLVIAAAWGFYNYKLLKPPTLYERFGTDDGKAHVQSLLDSVVANPDNYTPVFKELSDYMAHRDAWPEFYRNVITGFAKMTKHQPSVLIENFEPQNVCAFIYNPAGDRLLYNNEYFWLAPGDWVSDTLFFAGIRVERAGRRYPHFYVEFMDVDGHVTEHLLPEVPWTYQMTDSRSMMMIYHADMLQIFWVAASSRGIQIKSAMQSFPTARGVLYFTDYDDLMNQLLLYCDQQLEEDEIKLSDFSETEFYFWSHGYLKMLNQDLSQYFSDIMEGHLSLEWGHGKELLDGKTFTATGKWIMWQSFMNRQILDPLGLRCVVVDNQLHIYTKDSAAHERTESRIHDHNL